MKLPGKNETLWKVWKYIAELVRTGHSADVKKICEQRTDNVYDDFLVRKALDHYETH